MGDQEHHSTHPNNDNTVSVTLKMDNASTPGFLTLYNAIGQLIDVINVSPSKKFIFFNFPEGYTDFDIRVFEPDEVQEKTDIMTAYGCDKANGIADFDAQWKGWPSSGQANEIGRAHV